MHLFCPPEDLFALIINSEIDITNQGNIRKFQFISQYVGPYTGGLLFPNQSRDWFSSNLNVDLRMQIDFYRAGELLASKKTTSDYDPFYSNSGDGLMLFDINVPEEIPVDETLLCEVKILVADTVLARKFGSTRFYIKKLSEE